jgi:hypothetical protein
MTQKELPTNLNLQDALAVVDEEKTEMDKVLDILLDPNHIGHLTELNRNEILAFSALGTISSKRPSLDTLKTFLAHNLVYRVSKGRGGRKELVKVVSRQLQFAEQQMPQEGASGTRRWFKR